MGLLRLAMRGDERNRARWPLLTENDSTALLRDRLSPPRHCAICLWHRELNLSGYGFPGQKALVAHASACVVLVFPFNPKPHKLKHGLLARPPRQGRGGLRNGHRPGGARSRKSFAGAAVPVPVSGKRPARDLAGGFQISGGLQAPALPGLPLQIGSPLALTWSSKSAPAFGRARRCPDRRRPDCSTEFRPRRWSAARPTRRSCGRRWAP